MRMRTMRMKRRKRTMSEKFRQRYAMILLEFSPEQGKEALLQLSHFDHIPYEHLVHVLAHSGIDDKYMESIFGNVITSLGKNEEFLQYVQDNLKKYTSARPMAEKMANYVQTMTDRTFPAIRKMLGDLRMGPSVMQKMLAGYVKGKKDIEDTLKQAIVRHIEHDVIP
jgi:hypothetical protein